MKKNLCQSIMVAGQRRTRHRRMEVIVVGSIPARGNHSFELFTFPVLENIAALSSTTQRTMTRKLSGARGIKRFNPIIFYRFPLPTLLYAG